MGDQVEQKLRQFVVVVWRQVEDAEHAKLLEMSHERRGKEARGMEWILASEVP